ncbi:MULTISPECIES: EAL domain-containing protein [Paraburkholderia]|uniref:EAL domain-containing protein n=1 Tax=Paraburkholderia TaxID=1822464 RepID=UPI0003A3EFCD|nr:MULTISPECIES: EAL domain-containing protein [Paraburkholderia]MDH6147150.1 EAL domain-containing protein (putative c-di-GMP-specific phosphodiesterase class I) [Paraburkholderia sp. WSM4179]
MSSASKATSTTLPPESIGSLPIWRGISPRLSLLAAIICAALVLLTAVLLGERDAARAVAEQEWLTGNELVASVDRILNRVSSTKRAELAALVGRPCGDILSSLAKLHTYMRLVRNADIVADDRVYCSSGQGPLDLPLSVYVPSSTPDTRINLLPQTLFHPDHPVLALFDATGNGAGMLYLISGENIADALSYGLRLGAQHVALSVAGVGFLSDNDKFVSLPKSPPSYSTRVASGRWPFSITLTSSAEFASRLRWKYRLAFGAVGVLLDSLIAVTYRLALTPHRRLLRAVHRGLRHNEFHVVYQPIVDVASRKPVGAETLLRWDHPTKGAISPSLFMGAVESSSLLAEVTGFVLRTAVADANRYAPTFPPRVAVNIAPRDLERKGFAVEVLALSRRLPEGVSLVLELTERLVLSESAHTAAVFRILKAEGIKFAIDDFGTHHSNLDLLSRFPFDYVKIDRQFVSQVDTGGAELIKGIVSVAKHFGLQVIAEGVETEAQHRALQAAGVPFGQGYLYQRPVRVEQPDAAGAPVVNNG